MRQLLIFLSNGDTFLKGHPHFSFVAELCTLFFFIRVPLDPIFLKPIGEEGHAYLVMPKKL